ncbi:MAG: DUF1573 domain-containing protein [Nitrospirae bacterium]|nr:DUF1573 domain-containing protein [Nitrospirota bacterium]
MKSIIFTALFILMQPLVSHAGSSIAFDELSYNFGTVSQAEKAEHLFAFVNSGDSDLVIEKVSSS